MNLIKKFYLILLISFSVNPSVFSQNLTKEIDSAILTVFKDNVGRGGAFMVAKGGRVIYNKALRPI